MRQVLIAGGGGIGSFLVHRISDYSENNQFSDTGFTVYDDDVVDTGNIKYQNFKDEDILDFKVESLAARYGIVGVTERIESPDIFKDFACIVSAVDNKTFREMMFRAAETMDFHWIDLRSEGRSIAYYVKHKKNTLDVMLGTLPKEGGEDGSCQLEYEKNAGIIQNGNKIIAEMGAQLLLNWQRNEASKPQYIDRI